MVKAWQLISTEFCDSPGQTYLQKPFKKLRTHEMKGNYGKVDKVLASRSETWFNSVPSFNSLARHKKMSLGLSFLFCKMEELENLPLSHTSPTQRFLAATKTNLIKPFSPFLSGSQDSSLHGHVTSLHSEPHLALTLPFLSFFFFFLTFWLRWLFTSLRCAGLVAPRHVGS